MKRRVILFKGNEESGHHGHAGRKGKIGGSLPGRGVKGALELQKKMILGQWSLDSDQGFERGISYTYRVNIEGDGRAIAKRSFGADLKKEEFTWELARAMNFGIDRVPVSAYMTDVLGEIEKDRELSIQAWVENSKTTNKMLEYIQEEHPLVLLDPKPFEQIAWIDAIIGNIDRHGSNIVNVIDPDSNELKPYAIDNNFGYDRNVAYWKTRKFERPIDEHYRMMHLAQTGEYPEQYKYSRSNYLRAKTILTRKNSPIRKKWIDNFGQSSLDLAVQRLDELDMYLTDRNMYGDVNRQDLYNLHKW